MGIIRLTYHDLDVEKPRIANATTEPEEQDEIEVTPEMIEAGEDVLLSELGAAVSSYWWPDELAKRVFLAMAMRSSGKSTYARKTST